MVQGFRSWSNLQRFTSIVSAVCNLFVPSRSHRSASAIYLHRLKAMAEWKYVAVGRAKNRNRAYPVKTDTHYI